MSSRMRRHRPRSWSGVAGRLDQGWVSKSTVASRSAREISRYRATMPVSRSRTARAARRRKRRMALVEHDLTTEQWVALQAAWGGCAYCGRTHGPLQRDCVLPISRGGRYTLDNVVPACASCNTSKCDDEVTGWLRRKRLDERSFLLRHREVSEALA